MQLNILDKLKSLLIYYSNRYCKGGENGLDDEINGHFGDIFCKSQAIMDHKYSSAIGGTSFKDGDMVRYHIGSANFKPLRKSRIIETPQKHPMTRLNKS